jgi:hypothetical protein
MTYDPEKTIREKMHGDGPYRISPVVKTMYPPLYQVVGPHQFFSDWMHAAEANKLVLCLNLPYKKLAAAEKRIAELEAEKGAGNG